MKALEDYVQVHERIAEFWEKHPDGAIHTEVEFPDENTVRCRAEIFREAGHRVPVASGHAEERRDQGMVNKTSAVENCETSAVGRALALMGFSIHKGIASREEVEIAQRKAAAQNGAQKPAQSLPELYVDCLRLAIHSRDRTEAYPDPDEWAAVLAAANTKDQKMVLVEQLEAVARDLGLDPSLIQERWQAARVKAGT